MSGFVAVLYPDGRPLEPALLQRLTDSMAYRGPDGSGTEVMGPVGLGCSMLRTTFESALDSQPRTVDGRTWICGDIRLDARMELAAKLGEAGQKVPDSTLVLRAYETWEIDCLHHLRGDFAFAIWDSHARRLFCARDQFGVKQLYYARSAEAVVLSNTFDTVRLCPGVQDTLDELAIADELMFRFHQDTSATGFEQIRRLPPAHRLLWEEGDLAIERYWDLPSSDYVRYRSDREYVDHFREVFRRAVEDRLRCESAAISMSGGLDSTSVAGMASSVTRDSPRPCRLKAFTVAFQGTVPDTERRWATAVADHLGFPVHFIYGDSYPLFEDAASEEEFTGGSGAPLKRTLNEDYCRAVAEHSRIILTGFGGDPVLRGSSRYYLDQIKRLRLGALLQDLRRTRRYGKRPPLLAGTLWRRWQRRRRERAAYPFWINERLVARLDLKRRWRDVVGRAPVGWSAREDLLAPFWPSLFSALDPSATQFPLEYRHPFFDLRVVEYVLRVPDIPWFLGKLILREAMDGVLPTEVVARPKQVMERSPSEYVLHRHDPAWWQERTSITPELERFVDRKKLLEAVALHYRTGVFDIDQLTRPLGLALWLRSEERRARG